MGNLLENLKNLLQKDERLFSVDSPRKMSQAISQGEILKNKVIELAIKLDEGLIELLLSDEKMKEIFLYKLTKYRS